MPCLFAFEPFRGVKERSPDRNSGVDMGGAARTSPCRAGVAMTESITAALRRNGG